MQHSDVTAWWQKVNDMHKSNVSYKHISPISQCLLKASSNLFVLFTSSSFPLHYLFTISTRSTSSITITSLKWAESHKDDDIRWKLEMDSEEDEESDGNSADSGSFVVAARVADTDIQP